MSSPLSRLRSLSGLAAAIVMCLVVPQLARAQTIYRLSPGDIVQVVIAGLPGDGYRETIQLDGTIALPDVGAVPAAGRTLGELQARLRALVPTKMFHLRGTDGRDQYVMVKPDDISASVVEYRPIYVTGDVLAPGQQVYRPLMTVGQAIAAAGGFSLLHTGVGNVAIDQIDLRSQYTSLWTQYTRDYFHALRVQAELDSKDTFDAKPPAGASVDRASASAIADAERRSLQASLTEFEDQRTFLKQAMKEADNEIGVLQERQKTEQAGVDADEKDLQRINTLMKAGNTTTARIADARRALLLSSSRVLETTVQLMQTRRQRAQYARDLSKQSNDRTVNLERDLADTSARLADYSAKIQALNTKLAPGAGPVPVPLATGPVHPSIVVVRNMGNHWQRLPANDEFQVLPGDSIEVALRGEDSPVAARPASGDSAGAVPAGHGDVARLQ